GEPRGRGCRWIIRIGSLFSSTSCELLWLIIVPRGTILAPKGRLGVRGSGLQSPGPLTRPHVDGPDGESPSRRPSKSQESTGVPPNIHFFLWINKLHIINA